jgi:hypothetical protein
VLALIKEHATEQILVFVHSKAFGKALLDNIRTVEQRCDFHSRDAGQMRDEIESAFETGAVRVLVSTSTLAWGVNTVARRVIVAGTVRANQPVPVMDVQQMCGRAGRIDYHERGDAHVLVARNHLDQWTSAVFEPVEVRSVLCDTTYLALPFLCAVGARRVKNRDKAVRWLRRSFAGVQLQADFDLRVIVDTVIGELAAMEMLVDDDDDLRVTRLGSLTAQFYLTPAHAHKFIAEANRYAALGDPQDVDLARVLGDNDLWQTGWANKQQMQELPQVIREISAPPHKLKTIAAIYYRLLDEVMPAWLNMTYETMLHDVDRICNFMDAACPASDSIGRQFWRKLAKRVRFGLRPYEVDFVVAGLPKRAARKLVQQGVTDVADVPGLELAGKEAPVRTTLAALEI